MENIQGYTNSQTWEAWIDSMNVLWDNTEFVFLLSVTFSLGAVIYTWMQCPKADDDSTTKAEERKKRGSKSSNKHSKKEGKENDDGNKQVSGIEKPKLPANTKALTREIERRMSADDREKEKEVQNEQLAAIYKLMHEQKEKFGDTSIDEIKDQMKFYCR